MTTAQHEAIRRDLYRVERSLEDTIVFRVADLVPELAAELAIHPSRIADLLTLLAFMGFARFQGPKKRREYRALGTREDRQFKWYEEERPLAPAWVLRAVQLNLLTPDADADQIERS